MGWSDSQPSTLLKSSPKAQLPPASSEHEFQSTPPPPSYHSPQAMMFPELDSEQVPAVLPELDSTPTANVPRVQAPVPPLDLPAAVVIPTKEVEEAEQGGEPPVMKGNAGGPGWDNWNEQVRPRAVRTIPSTAYSSSEGLSLSQAPVPSQYSLQQVLEQQPKDNSGDASEEKEKEMPLSAPVDSRHQTVYVAYRPSSSQYPSPSHNSPPM